MEYQVFITVFVVVALILANELSSAMAAEPEGLVGRWDFDDEQGLTSLETVTTPCLVEQQSIHSVKDGPASK